MKYGKRMPAEERRRLHWAIRKHYRSMTDARLAQALKLSVALVQKTRERLGLKKARGRVVGSFDSVNVMRRLRAKAKSGEDLTIDEQDAMMRAKGYEY